MDMNDLTVEYCVDNYYRKHLAVILENGQVSDVIQESE